HTIERYYPHHKGNVVGFFDEVMRRTAWMVCEWMRVGFVHGVMNTDNMSILGLTIDYGPYGWVEGFDLDWTPNTTDASGRRYRFGHQPKVAHWNLSQLARALVPVSEKAGLERVLSKYPAEVDMQFKHMMLRKLGLTGHRDRAAVDDELLASLGGVLTDVETDMTLFFRALARVSSAPGDAFAVLEHAYYDAPDATYRLTLRDWIERYRQRIAAEKVGDDERRARMEAINPIYVPRNYLLQQVIEATEAGDRRALPEILDVLRRPYVEQPGREKFAGKRPEWARVKPGCSMLSCSS
ncbi:MAG: YdiU family protein, partial [Deltaproteobacteria bacterium]|nr:YdiU family protein [Deltaproteobacteria bacterium]